MHPGLVGLAAIWWAPKKTVIEVEPHLELTTTLLYVGLALLVAFFLVRPELWRRLWFDRVDPRAAGLLRIAMGLTVLLTFADLFGLLGEFLFTDEGLYLTEMARKNYGGDLKKLYDPAEGFEHWYDGVRALGGKFSLLHVRSDKPFVYSMYAVMLAANVCLILGFRTRIATFVTWLLMHWFYGYSPVYYTGGDTVIRILMFLALFADWGQAYSIDAWRWRRRAILAGSETVPALKRIAPWPMRLMMLQIAIVYCATGVLKSGRTWMDGTALYYALNLDHFYRVPASGILTILHTLWVTRLATILVHWWECLFPLALLGAVLRAYERDRAKGLWPKPAIWRRGVGLFLVAGMLGVSVYVGGLVVFYYLPPPYGWDVPTTKLWARDLTWALAPPVIALAVAGYVRLRRNRTAREILLYWVLGKRFWLVVGVGMHLGILLGMNVGTFVHIMLASYLAWIRGEDIDRFWRVLLWRPARPGFGGRPERPRHKFGRLAFRLVSPLDRLRYRVRPRPLVVLHDGEESRVRRLALIRCWDVASRVEFERFDAVGPEFAVRTETGTIVRGESAGRALLGVLPGLWPLGLLPAVSGRAALWVLHQTRGAKG